MKLTNFSLNIQLVLLETWEYLFHKANMTLQACRVDQNVVNICTTKFPHYISQHVIYEALDDVGGSRNPLRPDTSLEVARGGAKGCFPLITLSDAN